MNSLATLEQEARAIYIPRWIFIKGKMFSG